MFQSDITFRCSFVFLPALCVEGTSSGHLHSSVSAGHFQRLAWHLEAEETVKRRVIRGTIESDGLHPTGDCLQPNMEHHGTLFY